MNQTTLDIIILAAMAGTFVLGFWKKLPVGIIMVLASVVALLVGGFGLSFRHIVEGSHFFILLMSQIVMGMFFIKIMEATGALDAIARIIIKWTVGSPLLLLAILAVFVMFPAMFTGSTPVSVLTTGVIVAKTLMRIGVPKLETGVIVAIAALAGQSAPPVNVMVMIICTSTFMPYQGFELPLALVCFPQAILTAWAYGLKYVKSENLQTLVDEDRRDGKLIENGWVILKLFSPIILLIGLMILPRVLPFKIPDPNTPFMFLVSGLLAMFTGVTKMKFMETSRKTIDSSLTVLILFIGMGVIVQTMAATGVSGLLATTVVALPLWALFVSVVIGPILLGGPVVPFGVSAILGPPLVLAFGAYNSVIVTSAISLLLSLGCLVPPTALSSLFAGEILGMKNYMTITKRAWPVAAITIVVSVLMIYFANPIAKFLHI
jgi:GntP family gluconate:H+ symporter